MSDVTATNLKLVNAAVAASGNTALNASDVQALVDSVNAERASAEAAIQAHENGGVVAPTLGDYALAGVSGVNGTNLALVNAALVASGSSAGGSGSAWKSSFSVGSSRCARSPGRSDTRSRPGDNPKPSSATNSDDDVRFPSPASSRVP